MNYELAYHITPDLEEAVVQTRSKEIESEITKLGGSVMAARDPKKIHLSYPLAHKHYAHFGVIDFNAPAESITELDAAMKLHTDILRFLILKKPEVKGEIRTLGDHRARPTRRVAPTHTPVTAKPEVAPVEEKKIEKELEDVLGKIE